MGRFVDIDDARFWDILFDEAYVEGQQANRIEKSLEGIVVSKEKIMKELAKDSTDAEFDNEDIEMN